MADATRHAWDAAAPHRRPPAWVGDILAAVVVVWAAFIPFPQAEFRPADAVVLAVVVAPAALLPARRRWPVVVLGLIIGLYGVAALLGTLSPGIVLATAISMFTIANRFPRRTSAIIAVAAAVAVTLLSLLVAEGGVFDPRSLQFAVTIAFAAAAGDANRSRREYIRVMTERAERAESTREAEASRRVAEERLIIARDLHDAVAHQISVISLNAGVASSTLETRPERAREALASIRHASRTVLGEIGSLLEVLRGEDQRPNVARPQAGLDDLDELVSEFAAAGLAVTTRVEGDPAALPDAVSFVGYRIVQEGLTNAHKHGALHRAHVLVEVGEGETIVVITNPTAEAGGTLAETADGLRSGGHGLLGVRERAASVGGTMEAGAHPGGWRLAARLPTREGEPS
ncbi:sensor histidine kinase [Microbacterium sp. P01]|uniref:sensor histidine kinase n=1 Tax=unclassified Microbacterium TaxID=2609290 RepID=UPI003673123F